MADTPEDIIKLDPCPFCGTDPQSEEHPCELDEVVLPPPRRLEMTCGKCGAKWPPLTAKDAEAFDGYDPSDEIAAFLNRRAPKEG